MCQLRTKIAPPEIPLCFSDTAEQDVWNLPSIITSRLRLLKAVRWTNLVESGWPIFKILSLVTFHGPASRPVVGRFEVLGAA